jgi:DNA processing protein
VSGRVGIEAVRWARVWLSRAVEPGSVVMHRFLAQVGPVAAVAAMRGGRAPAEVATLAAARVGQDRVEADLALAAAHGIRLVLPEDDEWPDEALAPMEMAAAFGKADLAPPQVLWVRGAARLDEVTGRAVGMVGAREATSYGTWAGGDLAQGLAGRGWTVVSGGALGIDTACHRGALAAGGATVVVTAGGLCKPYPASNETLFDRIADSGLLVSEWPPDAPPQRHRFLIRNRLIAGLSAGTVVVEAGARSGARVTARCAYEYGQPVMAVPGPIGSALSVGTHDLIRDQRAVLVASVEHVLEMVGAIGADLAPVPRAEPTRRDRLSPTAQRVLDGLPPFDTVSADQIALAAGVPLIDVLRNVSVLELHGFIEPAPSGWRLTYAGRE